MLAPPNKKGGNMGKRRIFDEDVHEVFSTFGVEVAIFFEAIRFRGQVSKQDYFPLKSKDIKQLTGLSYKQQLRVRRVLEAAGWLTTKRGFGGVIGYRITDLARECIKKTPRRRTPAEMAGLRRFHKKSVNNFA